MFRASDNCGIMGIFGSRHEKAQTNAKNIEKSGKWTIAIADNLQQLANATDEIFFRVSDLTRLHEIRNQIIQTQNEKWQKINNSKYSQRKSRTCAIVINSYTQDNRRTSMSIQFLLCFR